jgi:hypothetical protein
MGFVKEPDVLKLTWDEGTKYSGLEVRAYMPSTGEYVKVVGMQRQDRLSVDDIEELYGIFAPRLIEWNLEVPDGEDGVKAIPATLEGLYSQDFDFISDVIIRWVLAIGSVEEELGKESPSGDPFPEESIPMDVLSASLQSSNAQN